MWAHEQTVTGKLGDGICLYLAGAVGSVVFIIVASGLGESWTWDQVTFVANIIVTRIKTP
jgi:hypothetical protein